MSSENREFDLIVKNVRVVRPNETDVKQADIGIKDGKFVSIAPSIEAIQGVEIFDAEQKLGFPGAVDAHMHVGIYSPLAEDALSESKAAAMGGVTTSLNYMRTGKYYLNKGGPYAEFFPKVSRRKGEESSFKMLSKPLLTLEQSRVFLSKTK